MTNPTDDLVSDSGAVLWSLILGEQIEFPVQLNFIAQVSNAYTFTVRVREGENNGVDKPSSVGVGQTTLAVRAPTYVGAWGVAVTKGQVVSYEGLHYEYVGTVATNTPSSDTVNWRPITRNTVYIQFPSTLGADWAVQPSVSGAIYGFIEMSVTEIGGAFPQTWKPVRGMVELLYSP